MSPKGELRSASPGRRSGPAAETHDRRKAPAASLTGTAASGGATSPLRIGEGRPPSIIPDCCGGIDLRWTDAYNRSMDIQTTATAALPTPLGRKTDGHPGLCCRGHFIRRLALFGSFLSGNQRPDSDIDLLVEFEKAHVPGLIALGGMANELSDILGRPVDLRTPQDLSRYFRNQVVDTAQVIHEQR